MWKQVLSKFASFRKWLWIVAIPAILIELIRDKISGSVNAKISDTAEENMGLLMAVLDWLSSTPFGLSMLLVVATALVLFIHSYVFVYEQGLGAETQAPEDNAHHKPNEFSELLGVVSAAKDRLYEKPFEEALIPEVNQWIDDTKELIRAAVGDAEASLFMSNSGIVSYGDGSIKSNIRIALERRSQRLNELIQRLDRVTVKQGFDGDKWREKFVAEVDNQDHVLTLAKRRSEGVSIRNDGQTLSSVDAIPGWIQRYVKWREDTTGDIRPLSEIDAEMFSRLDTYEPTPLVGNYLNEEHVRHIQHLTEWLKRLDAIIRKYQQENGSR